MLNIFVLEDDFFQQTRIETAIKKCMSDNKMRYRYLEVFGKPQQLLDAIKETGNHQFFFLDIEIKGDKKRGMEIAREIREKDPSASIVFVTTHSEFMPVTYSYRVSALDFIDKGLSDQDYQEAISSVLIHATGSVNKTIGEDSFCFKSEHSQIQVPFSDILPSPGDPSLINIFHIQALLLLPEHPPHKDLSALSGSPSSSDNICHPLPPCPLQRYEIYVLPDNGGLSQALTAAAGSVPLSFWFLPDPHSKCV